MRPAIRVGLRISEGRLPAYISMAVEQVLHVADVDVVLVLAVPPATPATRSFVHPLLERAYERLERSIFRGGPTAHAPAPAIRFPESVQHLDGRRHAEHADAVRNARLDVLLDLVGDDTIDGLPIPPSGRWRLRFANGEHGRRVAHLARPTTAQALAEAMLAIELDAGAGAEVCYAIGALHRIGFSRSRDALLWRSSAFPGRKLARLAAGDRIGDWVDRAPTPQPAWTAAATGRLHGAPPLFELLRVATRRVLERLWFNTSWMVLVRRRGLDDPPPADLRGFLPVDAPPGRFFADPFVVTEGSDVRIYVEDCPDGQHHGRIGALGLGGSGAWAMNGVVVADIEHRAYPHVIRDSQGLLMTPDSGRAGGVDFFRQVGPEHGWQHAGRCLEGVMASDPTLLEHDGRFWLFVAVTGHGMNPWDELHLYSADTLEGPWRAHPRNPVVADARRARPAGRIFRDGGTLIRPGQDCSTDYGRRIVLNAIRILSETEYAEDPIGSIEPTGMRGITRTHTYSFDGTIEALDGYHRRRRRLSASPRVGRWRDAVAR